MIRFKDFSPTVDMSGDEFKLDPVETALEAANRWLDQSGVEPLNVETVVLPNLYSGGELGTIDSCLAVKEEGPSDWYQFVRVWYRS